MARNPEIVTVDPDLGTQGRDEARGADCALHRRRRGRIRRRGGDGRQGEHARRLRPLDRRACGARAPDHESLADACPSAPMIVYSSLADAASVRRAMVAGARDYLVKPPRPEELSRAIYSVLEQEERKRLRADGRAPSGRTRHRHHGLRRQGRHRQDDDLDQPRDDACEDHQRSSSPSSTWTPASVTSRS